MLCLNKNFVFDSSVASLLASYMEGIRLLTQVHKILERRERQPSERERPVRSVDLKRLIAEYERDTWKRILVEMFTRKQMSLSRLRDLQAMIEAGGIPELTVENLHKAVQNPPSDLSY